MTRERPVRFCEGGEVTRERPVRFCEGGEVRFLSATRLVVGFEHEADARRFWDAMCKRFEEFALSLHPDKTRLIEFGRHAAARRAQRGLGKPETFKFLGFVFICARSRRGRFIVKRKSRRDRQRAKLKEIKEELRRVAALELIDVRTPRGQRGRHARTECAANARNRSWVA